MASRMEFNQRKANYMLFPILEVLPCVGPMSSEKDAEFRVWRARIFPRLCAWSGQGFLINYLQMGICR